MKRILSRLLPVLLVLSLALPAAQAQAPSTLRAAFLKGPTGMGAASLMAKSDAGEAKGQYAFTLAGAPDAVVAQLITGEIDLAALPTNTIALLHQRTQGEVQALAVNTLGVLYLLERGETVHVPADVSGKSIVSAAKGSTTEAVAGYLFEGADIAYVSEHAEAVAQAASGKYDLVLLPEPFVTSLLSQNAGFRIAMDVTRAWEEKAGTELPMGGIAVRGDFARENPDAVETFLREYAASVNFANENPQEAAQIIEAYDIMKAPIAEQAIPRANMVVMTGGEMRGALEAFYAVLMESNPDLIGGALPDASLYAAP